VRVLGISRGVAAADTHARGDEDGDVADSDVQRTVDAVWRMEAAKIVATLTAAVGDVSFAEDMAAEALVDALTQWPERGVPRNPGAWLTTVAKRKAIDHWRRSDNLDAKYAVLARELETVTDSAWDPDRIDDDVLRLVFMAAHPSLPRESQIALTLRLVGGLTTDEIAAAFLVPKATVAQRIVRAKKALTGVPFDIPDRSDHPQRLSAVLSVIYLVFNEGYSATAGDDWMRPQLCEDALRLGRILAGLVPDEPEVHGLVALMEIQASRAAARVGPDGAPVLLLDQDRSRWDPLLIRRGLAALARAEAQGGAAGAFALQAAIAACHARARTAADTDWARIVGLYERLAQVAPSPVVELNRAVAVSMASGPAAGLAIVDAIADDPAMAGYHLLPSVRGDLLRKLGRRAEARAELERAAAMTKNARERALLLERAASCA
jgi:RNA polymerase sigma factor (sigma-70 family)